MTNKVLFHGKEVTTNDYPALLELYNNRRQYRNGHRMPLECTQPHRGRMHLKMMIDGRLWAVHYPGEGGADCDTRIPVPEGPEHQHRKDYSTRALETAGYTVIPEYITGNGTRLDLAIEAPVPFGIEAQVSPITLRDAKTRTTKSARAGWPPTWLPGRKSIGDTLAGHVPVVRTNDTEIDWESATPAKGTVIAEGLRHITREKCTPSSRWNVCPDTKPGFCSQWHPWFNDVFRAAAGRRAGRHRRRAAGAVPNP